MHDVARHAAQAPILLDDGGETGALMRSHDWSASPLGDPATWPQSLRSVLGLLLSSKFPMFVAWGPELGFLYNDGYAEILGAKHPAALGHRFHDIWSEIWSDISPLVDAALAGQASYHEDLPLVVNRKGFDEQAWFTFSYSPLRDETGQVAGMFCVVAETTGRILAERRTAFEGQRLARLFEQAPGFITSLKGPEHVFEFANAAYRRLFNDRGFVGKTAREVFPDLEGQGFFDLLDRVYTTGERFVADGIPIRLEPPGAAPEERFLSFIYEPVIDEAGQVTGIFVEGQDVTETKRAEARREALVQLADRLRDLDDPIGIAVAASESLGQTLNVSRVGYASIDHEAETLHVERDWTAPGVETLAGTLRLRDFGSFIDNLKRGEEIAISDVRLDDRTAEAAAALEGRSARSFMNVPVLERGRLVAVFFINEAKVRDWSSDDLALIHEVAMRTRTAVERAQSQMALRELNETLESRVAETLAERQVLADIVESSSAATMALDLGFTILAINNAGIAMIERVYGKRPKAGDNLLDLLADMPELRAQVAATWGRALAGEEFVMVDAFGDAAHERVTFETRFSVLRDRDGRLIGATHTAYDISDRVRAQAELEATQEALRQSQKMEAVGQLTGGLAHDFNNLLGGISGSLELMATRITQGRLGDVERYLVAAQGAARRAAALTHRLLAFSRRQTLAPRVTDVNALVGGMEELIRRTVGPQVAVESVTGAGVWPVEIDPNQLENALLNLAINARDAMPDGGRLTIETANRWMDARAAREQELSPGQYVSLSVSDTGTGMPAEVVARAFDPFFTTKPIGVGTGLGLSMVYGFARQSGGQVRIYSEAGQGTTVCLYLPRHLGDGDAQEAPLEGKAAAPAGAGETVLVIDDEPVVRMLITDVLEELGYLALEASDGPEGLKALQSKARVDLLITDVGLPGGLNGRQVADAARALRPELKVLFITGYAENAVLNNGHLQPGMQVVTKPFGVEDLARRIRGILSDR